MIIACPDCSGPYKLPDDQIAALVQVECPHCNYRIILDFAAANDNSLMESGMKMASGYASEADYRAAAGGAPAARAQPTTPPAQPKAAPAPTPAAAPAASPPPSGPARSPKPPSGPAAEAQPASGATPETSRTILGQPPIQIPPAPPEDRIKTPPPLELTKKLDRPEEREDEVVELTQKTQPSAEAAAEPAAKEGAPAEPEDEVIEGEVEDEDAEEKADARHPPHTPPAKAAATAPPDTDEAELVDEESPAELSASMASPDVQAEPRSSAMLYFLVGMLLIVGVLVGFSFYETGDPNPMPLIDELIKSYTG
jgi:predicted Zn finger-like uncharacterized protein